MAQVTAHAPGTFSWVELSTTDPRGAVSFYRALFGWDVSEMPMGPGETYSTFKLGGKDAAAAYAMREEERRMGVPPHWNMYITVENADAATRRAQELGAAVLAPPFDVMEVGRMAVLKDPSGAVFSVWQPKSQVMGPHPIPGMGFFTVLKDPQGAIFAVFANK